MWLLICPPTNNRSVDTLHPWPIALHHGQDRELAPPPAIVCTHKFARYKSIQREQFMAFISRRRMQILLKLICADGTREAANWYSCPTCT